MYDDKNIYEKILEHSISYNFARHHFFGTALRFRESDYDISKSIYQFFGKLLYFDVRRIKRVLASLSKRIKNRSVFLSSQQSA